MGAADEAGFGRPRLLMAGMSNLDYIWGVEHFPPRASRTQALSYRRQGGGPAATAAATAARLGADVELWTFHSDDEAGAWLSGELAAFGVDVSQVRIVEGGITPVSAVLVTPEGERFIFPYRTVAHHDSDAGWDMERLARCGAVLFDGRYPALCRAVVEEARRLAIPVVADLGDAAAWDLAAYADHLVVSHECAQLVTGQAAPGPALPLLRQRRDQVVGITLGSDGSSFQASGDPVHVPAVEVAGVVDTTGAGDVFHGAYTYAIACGLGAHHSAVFASVVAAMKCTAAGGRTGIPSWSDLRAFVADRPELGWVLVRPDEAVATTARGAR